MIEARLGIVKRMKAALRNIWSEREGLRTDKESEERTEDNRRIRWKDYG